MKPNVAVFLHVPYVESLDEMLAYFDNIPDFDLYVTATEECIGTVRAKVREKYRDAVIQQCDKGQMIGGLVETINYLIRKEKEYGVFLIANVKEKKHEQWQRELMEVVETPNIVKSILNTFEDMPRVGMIGTAIRLTDCIASSGPVIEELLNYFSLNNRVIKYFGGSIFWIRAEILYSLFKKFKLTADFFDCPKDATDQYRPHAMEMIMGNIVKHYGYRIQSYEVTY